MIGRILRRLAPRRLSHAVERYVRALSRQERPAFPELAYLPYAPGADGYALPKRGRPDPGAALPVPPERLWVGAGAHASGEALVRNMLHIVEEAGCDLATGTGRILELGCGDGRLLRHLAPLADRYEIWGSDISAEHIFWCAQHLSPPFHFTTNTKVPHLPFADASFRFVLCGSLFTHIDDLARPWLLELRRLLEVGGLAYVTIHDGNTLELFEDPRIAALPIARHVTSSDIYRQAGRGFGMLTIGRDERSQVFYDLDFFRSLASPAFEIVSVTPGAFNLQTAVLLKAR